MTKSLDVAVAQNIAELSGYRVVIVYAWGPDDRGGTRAQRLTFGKEPADKDWAVAVADKMEEAIGLVQDSTPAQFVEDFRAPSEAAVGKAALDYLRQAAMHDSVLVGSTIRAWLSKNDPRFKEPEHGQKEDRVPPY